MPENSVPVVAEVAPNSSISTSQNIPIGFEPGQSTLAIVNGSLVAGEDSADGTLPGTLDIDTYNLNLNAGDVVDLGAYGSVDNLVVFGPDGTLLLDSLSNNADITGPRPGPNGLVDARATASFVATQDGTYILSVPGVEEGQYSITANVSRSALDSQPEGTVQYLYLDFDGAEGIDTTRFGGGATNANLSGISAFLENWGLTAEDENAVITSISDEFSRIFAESGANVQVITSREFSQEDLVGFSNVSTIVVGGTTDEAQLGTIGAGFIDVGNLNSEDDGFVLLDTLSSQEDSQLFPLSANNIELGEGFTRVDAVGRVVGAYAAREAGHLLGLYDTEGISPVGSQPPVVVTDEGFFSDLTFEGEDDVLNGDDFFIGFGTDQLDGSRLLGEQDANAILAAVTNANGGAGFANRPDLGRTNVTGSDRGNQIFVGPEQMTVTDPAGGGDPAIFQQTNDGGILNINGGEGPNNIEFGPGVNNNSVVNVGSGGNTVVTGFGRDEITAGDGDDTINGHLGNDTIIGGDGNDNLVGSFGVDVLGGGNGNDQIDAGIGDDIVFGDAGDDRIYGRDGNDRIDGGEGNDKIAGGAGSDTFVFTNGSGQDRIYDFEAGIDRIRIDSALLGEGSGQLTSDEIVSQFGTVSEDGETVTLDFGNGNSVTINNPFVDLADLASDLEVV